MKRTFVIAACLALLVTTGNAHAQAIDDGLTGYWPLDQTEGNSVFNVAGAEEVGTIFGADWVMDQGRSALSFNRGEQDYVDTTFFVPALTVADDDFTWSYWGKNGAGNGNNDVILGNRFCGDADCNPRQFIKFTPTRFEYDRLDSGIEDITYSQGKLVDDGPWAHHLVTKEGPVLTYYRDGQFDSTITLEPEPDFQDPQPFYFGGDRTRENWTGLMDDVALWTRALADGEVATIAAAGAEGLKSLIVGDPKPAPVAGRNMIGSASVGSMIVDGSLEFGPAETGAGLSQEWFAVGNPGNKAAIDQIFADNLPRVPAFRAAGGSSWWTGNSTALTGVPAYPAEVQPPLNDNYTVRSTGEILIEQSGPFTFTDGVDDYTYLAIDTDRSGVAGDTPEEVLIDDNTWTTVLRDGNGGGAGYAEITIDNVAEEGEWLAIEFNMGEGGGGDSGVIYWDYDTTAPFDQRNAGLLLPFVDQAFFSVEEAEAALIPDSYLRSTTAPLLSGEVGGSIPGSPLGWELDVNANDGNADTFALANPDPAIFTSTFDVDGAQFFINVLEGEVSDGDSFPILIADNVTGTPTIGTDGWSFDAATGSVVFGGTTQICGDFDMDGDVDVADRTIQTINWTGAGNVPDPPKTFAEGDCDGDGDVDVADQTGTIQNWTGAQNAGNVVDGDDADLIYDPETGNVVLDATDTAAGEFISFVVGTDQNNMRPENAAFPFINTGTNTDAETFQIGQTDALNLGAGPQIELGAVFPTGIETVEALAEYLTIAEYASDLGAGGTLDLHVIPEPSGLVLGLLALLAITRYPRRRRS